MKASHGHILEFVTKGVVISRFHCTRSCAVMPRRNGPAVCLGHRADDGCVSYRNMSVKQWKSKMIPKTYDGEYSQCVMYSDLNQTGRETVPCSSWEFEDTGTDNAFVQDVSVAKLIPRIYTCTRTSHVSLMFPLLSCQRRLS